MLAAPAGVSAHSPGATARTATGDAPAQALGASTELNQQEWAQLKAELNSSTLPRSVTVADGVRTFVYTLASGSQLVLEEPVGRSVVTTEFSVGGCGFLRLCVWLNRGDQLVVLAGATYLLVAAICLAAPLVGCLVVGAALVMAQQWLNNRGYICSNYLVVELAFSPGTIRGCY
jgi:hypothetical protein